MTGSSTKNKISNLRTCTSAGDNLRHVADQSVINMGYKIRNEINNMILFNLAYTVTDFVNND